MVAIAYPTDRRPRPHPIAPARPVGRGGERPSSRPTGRPAAQVFRRRRIVALAALAVGVVGAIVLWRAALAGPGGAPLSTTGSASVLPMRPIAAQVYVVQPGDTLWSIARSAGVVGDLRPVVDRLAAQVGHGPLLPGQRLVLPSGSRESSGG
jgi:LysM domain